MHCHNLKELLQEWGRLGVGLWISKKEGMPIITGELITISIALTRQW